MEQRWYGNDVRMMERLRVRDLMEKSYFCMFNEWTITVQTVICTNGCNGRHRDVRACGHATIRCKC